MSDVDMWSGIVGFVLPVLIAAIKRQGWPASWQAVCAFVVCWVAAAGTAYLTAQLDPQNLVRAFLVIFTLAIVAFYGFWKPTGVEPVVDRSTG